MQRKKWIDNLRGFCMLAILLDHTEIYYTGNNIIDYNLYVANALVLFFILSGYLMYKDSEFNIKHKLHSILRGLLIPYFIFTTILYIPKSLIHGNGVNIPDMAINILTGQASWFVAALCIAELIFSIGIWISKGKNILLPIIGILGFGISIYLSTGNQPYFWQLDNALQALLFLCIGYFYHKYELVFNRINKPLYITILFIFLFMIKQYEHINHVDLLIWNIHITNYPIFLIDIFISSFLMIQTFKMLPNIKCLCWTGKYSIVYYFLCGGVPLLTSKLFTKLGCSYHGNYLFVIIAFIFVYSITTIITYFIYRYIPFVVGKKYE